MMGKERKEERTYIEKTVRSCHPVGEANLRKIWDFSRSKVKIDTLGRGSDAWERGDGDVSKNGRIVDVTCDPAEGDRLSSEWLGVARGILGTTMSFGVRLGFWFPNVRTIQPLGTHAPGHS